MSGGAAPGMVAVRRARLHELPGLVRLVVTEFLKYDPRYQSGGLLQRATRRARVFAGAWGEMLATDVWTDRSHDAVVCETPERWKPGVVVATVVAAAVLVLGVLRLSYRAQALSVGVMVLGVLALVPALVRERRRSQRHRPGAAVLTFLASRRPGAGRALLDARCQAADARRGWLCLDAPVKLEGYYAQAGFRNPDAAPGHPLVYMEREPTTSAGAGPRP